MLDTFDDQTLIELIAAGEDGAFAALYSRYARKITGFIYNRLSLADQRRGITEDLVQEAFLFVFQFAPRYKREYKAPWWVYQRAKLALQRERERRQSMKRDAPTHSLAGAVASRNGDPSQVDGLMRIPDPLPKPDEQLIAKERRRALAAAVADLPEKYRQAVALNLQGWKYSRIAAELNLPAKVTLSRITYGRALVQQRLQA